MASGEHGLQSEAGAFSEYRKVSLSLAIGVLLMPPIFVWFLLRRCYSWRIQTIGVGWLGVIGLVLLFSAPRNFATEVSPEAGLGSPPRSWEAQSAGANQAGGPSSLDFKLSQTRSVYRMLRTTVTLKNNVGRDLQYVEVLCSYYDPRGSLLGYGMSNWATVKAGQAVSGEVVASAVAIDDVKRRECRARYL